MSASRRSRPHRLLVVDDAQSNRLLAERVLRKAGYTVVSAASGDDALELISLESEFDLFVLDVKMPGMSGTELADRIRANKPDAKILYFTAYSGSLFATKNVLGENEAFLDKPATTVDLVEAVSLLLHGHLAGPGGPTNPAS